MFKIHGYPPSTKSNSGKRIAAVAPTNISDDDVSIESTGLSTTQFNHLITLLGKHTALVLDAHSTDSTSLITTPHLAGIFCLSSKHNSHGWIVR